MARPKEPRWRAGLVYVSTCRACGIDLVISCVPRELRDRLPYSPNKGPWRAFEREQRVSPRAWRSTKRIGFIPVKPDKGEYVGFLPHDCPKADWREGVSIPA